jgi:proteasome accessory factor B
VVETLSAALAAKKRVHVRYRKRGGEVGERALEPYGLFLKRGGWYLCARDPDRDAVRVFRVSRIEAIEQNAKKPGTPDFAVPRGFDVRAYAALDPLRLGMHEPVEASVRIDPEIAFLCERMWGVAPDPEGVFRITTTHLDVIVEQVLGLGRRAELLAPESARRAVVEALERVLAAHGERP